MAEDLASLRDSIDGLLTRLAAIEAKLNISITGAIGPTGVTGATGVPVGTPLKLTATPAQGAVKVDWSVTGTPVFIHVERDGNDTGGGGPWGTDEMVSARTRTFNKLTPATAYTFTVQVKFADGSIAKETVKGTPEAVAAAPTVENTGGRTLGLAGKSGLKFNSLVFLGGDPNMNAMNDCASKYRGGRPFDGALYFASRGKWSDFTSSLSKVKPLIDAGLIVVMSIPHAPESEGSGMNQKGANDGYAVDQRAFGKAIKDMGVNSPNLVLRVDWEANGDWYAWSANRPGGAPALKGAIGNFIKNTRAGGSSAVNYDICYNNGPSQSKADYSYIPDGDHAPTILAVDSYDWWNSVFNDQQWNQKKNLNPGFATTRDEAIKRGMLFAIDECGPVNASPGGGDNPFYLQKLWDFINEPTTLANLAYHNTYNHEGAPAALRHRLDQNPKFAQLYTKLFGR